jgi:LssY C-terminus
VNIGIEGSEASILAAFKRIGWVQADPLSPRSDLKMAEAAALSHAYPAAPVSNLYLFGRAEDFAVEHEIGATISRRDHARFWDTHRDDPVTHLRLWIGDASRDVGVEILRRHHLPVGTTHRIDPNIDAERNLIAGSLQQSALVQAELFEPGMGATKAGKNGNGDPFFTDGKAAVVVLKP